MTQRPRIRKGLPALVLLLAAAAILLLWGRDIAAFFRGYSWQDFQQTVRGSGAWAPLICILLNAAFTVLILPTTAVNILIGLLFGVARGLPISLAGHALGMAASFLLSRYLLRNWLNRRFGDTRLYLRLEENLQREGWKLVLFSRLLPINPYSFLNYAYGLTPIRFGPYLLASVLGVIPNLLALLWTSDAAGQLATGRLDWRVLLLLFAGAGLFAVIAWLPRLIRRRFPNDAFLTEKDGMEAEEEEG